MVNEALREIAAPMGEMVHGESQDILENVDPQDLVELTDLMEKVGRQDLQELEGHQAHQEQGKGENLEG